MTAQPVEQPDRLVSLDEAAARVGLSTKTVRRGIATAGRHNLRAAKVRGQWRIRISDLNAWVDSYTVRAVRSR